MVKFGRGIRRVFRFTIYHSPITPFFAMLRSLSIRDFVIVDRLELEFAPGFTVLTGETGAGKSILIDALTMVPRRSWSAAAPSARRSARSSTCAGGKTWLAG
jgi:DNA repair protein RecN (Recombination protein N)